MGRKQREVKSVADPCPGPPFKGRYFVKRAGKRLRLVGAGVAGRKGGDPWVALRPVPLLFPYRFAPAYHRRSQGDASVPTPLCPSPAPTTVTICPKNLLLKALALPLSCKRVFAAKIFLLFRRRGICMVSIKAVAAAAGYQLLRCRGYSLMACICAPRCASV